MEAGRAWLKTDVQVSERAIAVFGNANGRKPGRRRGSYRLCLRQRKEEHQISIVFKRSISQIRELSMSCIKSIRRQSRPMKPRNYCANFENG